MDIIDNRNLKLGDVLREHIPSFDALDVATGYFNLRGWDTFEDLVAAMPTDTAVIGDAPARARVRVLIGMMIKNPGEEALEALRADLLGRTADNLADQELAKQRRDALLTHLRDQLQTGRSSAKDRAVLTALKEHLQSGRVEVRVYAAQPLHGKTYVLHRDEKALSTKAFVGSANLTGAGLYRNLELNVDVYDPNQNAQLAQWFKDLWEHKFALPVTSQLLDILDESWVKPRPPYEVFLKVCYDMSSDVRNGLAEYSLPSSLGGRLLPFQSDAVRTLARRVMRNGGAMLGDVVGMGKTIVAIAVALTLREHGITPLIICPVNLERMWQGYLAEYGLSGSVVPFSKAAAKLPLEHRRGLVIVDEAHTLRSDTRQDYRAIADYIETTGARVLLLTATPYNLRFADVGNQLRLYVNQDADLGIEPTAAFTKNPQLRLRASLDGLTRSLRAFMLSEEPEDWSRLMSEHLVRRTRAFIIANYGRKDAEGRDYIENTDGERFTFPKRDPRPKDLPFHEDDPAAKMVDDQTLDTLAALLLPRYRALAYLDPGFQRNDTEQTYADNLLQAGGNVAGFVRTTFYKRLSSCGHSFLQTLRRHVTRNELWLHAIDNDLPIPAGTFQDAALNYAVDDDDAEPDVLPVGNIALQYDSLVSASPADVTWVRPAIFTTRMRSALAHDTDGLKALLEWYGLVDASSDSKLAALLELVTVAHADEKVLIFTEYKETAEYVSQSLSQAGVGAVDVAHGQSRDVGDIAHRFSPGQNALVEGEATRPLKPSDEIRVLVSTDVLSEGANLQAARIIINYDLPWAIIRLIQRAGRVDRIGQSNREVVIYSLFHGALDGVLDLRLRVRRRLRQAAEAFGSDERFFDEELGDSADAARITALYNGQLDDESAQDVDPASQAYEYWRKATEDDAALAARVSSMPDLTETARLARPDDDPGVICFVRTESQVDGFGWASPDGADLKLMTGHEALGAFMCGPLEPGQQLSPEHSERITQLISGPLSPERVVNLTGLRKRVYTRLTGQLDIFDRETSAAVELIAEHPLTSIARNRLSAALRSGALDDELAGRVVALYRDGDLVIPAGEDPLRIVTSMGVI